VASIDRVIFDFYFSDVSEAARPRNRASIEVSHTIQEEDAAILLIGSAWAPVDGVHGRAPVAAP
jgi:hypothetical protein